MGIKPGRDGALGGGGCTCCGEILHNRKRAGRMLRQYQEIGAGSAEPGNLAPSRQKLLEIEAGRRSPQEKQQIVCRRETVCKRGEGGWKSSEKLF